MSNVTASVSNHIDNNTSQYLKVKNAKFPPNYDFKKLRVILFEYIIAKEIEWSMSADYKQHDLEQFSISKVTYSKLLLHPLIITFGNGSSKSLFETISNFKYKYRFGIISSNLFEILNDSKKLFEFITIENSNRIFVKEKYSKLTIDSFLEEIKRFKFDEVNNYNLEDVFAKKNESNQSSEEYSRITEAIDSAFFSLKRNFFNLLDLDLHILVDFYIKHFGKELNDFQNDDDLVNYQDIEEKMAFY